MSLGRNDLSKYIVSYLEKHGYGKADEIAWQRSVDKVTPTACVGEVEVELWRMSVQGKLSYVGGMYRLAKTEE